MMNQEMNNASQYEPDFKMDIENSITTTTTQFPLIEQFELEESNGITSSNQSINLTLIESKESIINGSIEMIEPINELIENQPNILQSIRLTLIPIAIVGAVFLFA